ncbi:hypothetical protein MUA04_00940 [Enterobacteriaceae bacterium H11S18]|uniref:hypothetical protein n=1 Tax=Dryocola clanedunensis TaxID=2925396 RepID=UPI0022F11A09|nr:hypothetical protein [Dryocola clanedunensis]MCT4708802.1 hypothetical protein [Dryocola clanedunensis]
MNITTDDYDVINAYAGSDRSWHDRVSTTEGVQSIVSYSDVIARMFIVSARYESKEGDSHDRN